MAPKKRSYSYWKENFERLEEFKKKHGHCRVPQKFADDRKLGTWVTQQRSQKKNISAEKRKLRDGIGFDWAPLDAKWNEMYERLAAYKKEHGVCHVPENVDKTLRQWICNQRTYQRNGALLPDREAKLNHIEFRWANEQTDQRAVQLRHDRWQANYDKLVEFKQEHGHCLVPHNCKDHSSLGRFVSCQRMFKLGLTSKQIGLLDEIGFQWTCNKRSSRSVENNQEDACDDEVSLNDEGTIVSHAKSVDAKRSDTERASTVMLSGWVKLAVALIVRLEEQLYCLQHWARPK
jgi:hypothetical protein